ncbi:MULTISPECIES: hypothetical protein [Mameliella]|uniref:Uncharacterized protein n=1 Tax=Mameliella alba TaxID=561184 RepID=A0A0B3SXE4_9RHOB|nr:MULTISPECIES: hypothetical protein [Mameliella]ODM48707.1 hypothetical protein A9320_03235 [Ruegeria sp. PBVC088]KHQ55094.1 hypothetical protein OA50_00128 [Mameliella alba]MDD9733442.1 hypothetical protein [Mameliella sp. AT18]OWV49029.1 hypothetical protein CDZ96_06160 [Mameliella alba]PTR40988.1 hypothetical protein LX94_01443 [Mameliella alba]
MSTPRERRQVARPVQRPDPGIADLARGANGLGESDDMVKMTNAMTGMVSAGMHGALAVGLSGAALTLNMMARLAGLGSVPRRRQQDDREEG